MTWKEEIPDRFRDGDQGSGLLYLPDLSLWYEWHERQGSLPERWQGASLPAICRAMGVPAWLVFQPWRVETPGVETVTSEARDDPRAILGVADRIPVAADIHRLEAIAEWAAEA